MRRWAINLFCLFSLLIFVGSVAIWVSSYFALESVGWSKAYGAETQTSTRAQGFSFSVVWGHGCIQFFYHRLNAVDEAHWGEGFQYKRLPFSYSLLSSRSPASRFYFQSMQFQLSHDIYKGSGWWRSQRRAVAPLWLFLPLAIPPILWLRRRRRSQGRGFEVEAGGKKMDSFDSAQDRPLIQ